MCAKLLTLSDKAISFLQEAFEHEKEVDECYVLNNVVGSNTGSACIVVLLPIKQLLSGGSMDATHLQYYTSLVCVAVSYWMIAIWEQIKL